MVWEWKCHTIVMLTEVQEREQVRGCPARASGVVCTLEALPTPCGRCLTASSLPFSLLCLLRKGR